MANEEHLNLLSQGVEVWNKWRKDRPDIGSPNLSRADLSFTNLSRANLIGANLIGASLHRADLTRGILSLANLSGAHLTGAFLHGAILSGADLSGAFLIGADLSGTDMNAANRSGANRDRGYVIMSTGQGANLSGAVLTHSALVKANLTNANLTGCRIYGISAWDLRLENAKQENLIVTDDHQAEITVDNIEVAQFIYLLLYNKKIRDVIDTITSKAVLILGRFTPERKAVLDTLRKELRKRDYLPILFDFDKPAIQTTDETITLLARMARFVIADISDAKSVLHELRAIVPDLPTVPVQPIIVATQEEEGMFDFFRHYPWFLETHRYDSQEQLIVDLGEWVIRPAEAKVLKLRGAKPETNGPVG